MTGNIVRYAYRPKRARKPKPAVELSVPIIVRRGGATEALSSETKPRPKAAMVTARKPGKVYRNVPDLTEEELQRRRDAADAVFREVVRRTTAKVRDQL
jgi:hypothetical protein